MLDTTRIRQIGVGQHKRKNDAIDAPPLCRFAGRDGRLSPGQISRLMKRLRVHGLIKRIGGADKYDVTEISRRVVIASLKLKQLLLVPALAA